MQAFQHGGTEAVVERRDNPFRESDADPIHLFQQKSLYPFLALLHEGMKIVNAELLPVARVAVLVTVEREPLPLFNP